MEQIRGIIYKIDPLKVISEKFRVQTFVVQEDLVTRYGEQTSHYQVQAANDKIILLDGLREGMDVKVKFFISGRKYINRNGQEGFMTTLNLVSLERDQNFSNKGAIISQNDPIEDDSTLEPQSNDLPF